MSDVTAHCHEQCASAHVATSASPHEHLTDSVFAVVMTPYTHACKGRPRTVVGWASLGVIVIDIVTYDTRYWNLVGVCL